MNLEKKAVKGVVWSLVEKWGGQLISTSVFLLLARLLGPEDFGLVSLASVFIAFSSSLVNQGFVPAIIQREKLDPGHLDTAFWTSLGMGLLLAIGTISMAGQIAELFNEPKIRPIVQCFSLVFLLIALQSVQFAILQRDFAFKRLAFRSLAANFVSGAVSVGLAFAGFGAWSLVVQQLLNRIVNVLMLWTASSWRPGFNVSLKHFRDLFSFGANVMGVNFLKFFNQRSDDLLIGYFLGAVPLGYYAVAYKLLRLMVNILTNATAAVALPTFSRLQQDPERLKSAFYKVTQLTSCISFPAFIGVAVLAPELIHVLFGKNWELSIPVMRILALVGMLQSISFFNGTVMMAKGKPSWRLWINCLNAVFNVIGFAIAVQYGIVAVALAFVISNYLLIPVYLWVIKRLVKLDLSLYLRQYAGPLFSSGCMLAQIYFLKLMLKDTMSEPALLSLGIITGIVTYLMVLTIVDRKLSEQMFKLVKKIL